MSTKMELKEVLGREMAYLILSRNKTRTDVKLMTQFELTIMCQMRFHNFPFNKHVCPLKAVFSDVAIVHLDYAALTKADISEQDYEFTVSAGEQRKALIIYINVFRWKISLLRRQLIGFKQRLSWPALRSGWSGSGKSMSTSTFSRQVMSILFEKFPCVLE